MLQGIIEKAYCRYERENNQRHLKASKLKMPSRVNLIMRGEWGVEKERKKKPGGGGVCL